MTLTSEAIRTYAVKSWLETGMTVYPDVRQTARRFKVRQKEIIDLVESDSDMCLEYYNADHKPGDKFIYVINDEYADKMFQTAMQGI